HDHRGDTVAMARQELVHVICVSRPRMPCVEQQWPVQGMEHVYPADGHSAERVAVVGVLEADETGALRLVALGPPLKGHLERYLDRGRSAVRVEHPAQARR